VEGNIYSLDTIATSMMNEKGDKLSFIKVQMLLV
jgi:hypothetical protein